MPPSTPLDIFIALARRPHTRQCLNHTLRSSHTQWPRYASNIPPATRSAPDPNAHQPPSVQTIPLHVGLDRNPTQRSAISKIPIPRGQRGETFTPSVLSVPLGLPYPPQPGQNSPYDQRSWHERREEFTDRTKVLERRRVYLRSYLRPYFQEWRRLDYARGKSFVSNPKLLRRDKALYFPNLVGHTLAPADGGVVVDSGPRMLGKISVVGMMSGHWAEEQVDSFVGAKLNPRLQHLVERYKASVQRVHVNMQSDTFRLWLVKMFKGRARKLTPQEEWMRYFIVKLPRDVRRGLTEEARDAMGLLNSQVGYVYLLDSEAKIRWAGSGEAWEGEREGLNNAVERLVLEEEELKTKKKPKTASGVGSLQSTKDGTEPTRKAKAVAAS